jgi:hypothetical protein
MYWKYCMASNVRAIGFSFIVASRPLEDRIRQLCADAVAASASDLEPVITELKVALHEHTERLRKLAASKLALAMAVSARDRIAHPRIRPKPSE